MTAATINFDKFLVDFETRYPQYLGCIYSVFDADERGVIKDNGIYLDGMTVREYGFKQKDIWQGFNEVLAGKIGFEPDKIWMVTPSEMYAEAVA